MEAARKTCTVILRTRNSEALIGQTLSALFSQEYRDFELTIVDSGSTDSTLEIAGAWPHDLVRIDPGDYFPGRVLNSAAGRARGEILVFLNSDCVLLTAKALGRLVGALDDPDVVAAFARQIPRPGAAAWVRREYAAAFPESGNAPPWLPFSLPFAAMRLTAWRMQPFYTRAWGSEDTEWGNRAISSGLTVRYVPSALVMHSHDYTPFQIYGRRFIEGEADAYIYGTRDGFWPMLRRAVGRTVRDWASDLAAGEWGDIPVAPIRRMVGSWAYHKGNLLGNRRIREGDEDGSTGQREALRRHESGADLPDE